MTENEEAQGAFDAAGSIIEVIDIVVQDGEFEPASWVYVWLHAADPLRVGYVGATWLPPAARTYLHLHDPDPSVGHVRANHPDLLDGGAVVRAFRIAPELDRRAVRSMVAQLLDGDDIADVTGEGRVATEIVSLIRDSKG